MGMFIEVVIDEQKCLGIKDCGNCLKACPVGVFAGDESLPKIVEENEDECIICDQCLINCRPDAITVRRMYG